jgi:hypothetical protein
MSQNPFADPYQSPQPFPTGYVPLAPGQKPAVWFWYVAYCTVMALLYLGCIGFVLIAFAVAAEEISPSEKLTLGLILTVLFLPLFLLYAAAPFLPPSRFAWVYGFFTIGIGFTSCCTLPFSIALIIQWIKPEVRGYFNAL